MNKKRSDEIWNRAVGEAGIVPIRLDEFFWLGETMKTGWVELTEYKRGEKVHLRAHTIVGVRPCGTAEAGAVVDLVNGYHVMIEESVEEVFKRVREQEG